MRKKKKVYISAYSAYNLGDDLFVLSLVRRYPQCKFFFCANPRFTKPFLEERNLHMPSKLEWYFWCLWKKVLRRPGVTKNILAIKRSDVLVRIGGSFFMEYPNWEKYRTDFRHENIFVVGANFGPCYTEYFRKVTEQRILEVKDCCFRDKYSYNMFKNLGNVRYAPDVILGYEYLPEYKQGVGITVSVISLEERQELKDYAEEYYCTIASLCDECAKRNIPITLLGFCAEEKDDVAINKIVEMSKFKSHIGIYIYDGDIDSILEKINEAELILASRFHAMVLGMIMKKRVVPIIYSEKQVHVLEDIGFNGFSWDLLRRKKVQLTDILDEHYEGLRVLDVEEMKKTSELQFEALDKVLLK